MVRFSTHNLASAELNMRSLSQLLNELKRNRYPYYLYVMIAPLELRAALTTILSLEWELEQIPRKVSEPLLGQIRFAWWQEALEMLEAGDCPRAHPVIEAVNENKDSLPLLKQRLAFHQQCFENAMQADLEVSLIDAIGILIQPNTKWQRKVRIIQDYAACKPVSPRSVGLLIKLFF